MDKLFTTSLVAGLLLLFMQLTAYSDPGNFSILKDGDLNEFLSLSARAESTPAVNPGALEGLTVTIPDVSVQPGDQFCLDVSVSGFNNILGMQFSLAYDPDLLTFDAIQNINLNGLSLATIGTPPDETDPGQISLSWIDPDLAGLDVPDGTVIFELCFIATNTDATATVDFSNTPTLIEITDGDENTVMFNGDAGTITIGAGGNGGGSGDFLVTLSDETVAPGGSFCVDVSVSGFTNILGMQFSLAYDPSLLTFDAIQNINLNGLSEATIGTPPDETDPGQISLSWLDPDLAGLDVPDGTVIFQVCFTATNSDATATFDFSNTPTLIEITDGDENAVTFNGEESTITIGAGGNGGGSGDFLVTLSDETVAPGGSFCVDVSVSGFTNILGMQFSLAYDPSLLTFDAIQNINLNGLSEATIGTPPDETDPGQISLSWLDPDLAGLDVPDGTVIFQVCFTATNSDATATFDFSNTPTLIEITDGDENAVTFNGEESTITIGAGGNGGGSGDFLVTLSDETVAPGGSFCVDVSVSGFTNILGMQFSLAYDPSLLTFDAIQNINLNGLSDATIGTPPDETDPGQITLSWIDPDLAGLDVPDGTVIFQICFTAIDSDGTTTIDFSDTPTLIEVTDGDENPVPFNGESSTVTIGGGGGGGPDGFTVSLSDESVNQGEQVCVDVSVFNFTNILGMQFSLAYDPAVLEFDAIQNINLNGLSEATIGTPPDETDPGQISLSWIDPDLAGLDVPDGTVIFQICFTAIGGDGTTTIDFSDTPTLIEVTDGDENPVPFNGESSTVTIGGGGGGGPDGFTVSLSDESVNQGEQVCVDVSVFNFTNILGMQFSLDYDPAVLEFDAIQNINLNGLSEATIGTPPDETDPGQISLSWIDPDLAGLDVPDGTVIFQVCFTALTSSGTTTIDFSNTPTLIEVTDGDENPVPFNGESSTVTIGGGGGPDGFTVSLSDESVNQGEQVCVDVSVFNFTNILGLQFSLDYDPAVLEFDAIQNINLNGLSEATIGTPPDETDPGQISLSWIDPDLAGLDVPDGTVIFQVCFTALTSSGTTTIDFSDTPTLIEVTDGDENPVPFNGESSTITIGNGDDPPNYDNFTIVIDDVDVESGDQFCVNVDVYNFTDVVGMQFSVNYDPSMLSFVSVGNFGLDGLNLGQFGLPGDGGVQPGQITLVWVEPNTAPLTLPDGTAIFEVCFDATGPNGTTTNIDVTGTPTPIEVSDGDGNIITPVDADNSTVNISTVAPPQASADITDVDCFGNANGAISISVSGGTGDYTYDWSGPDNFSASSQDINDLDGGTYTVMIDDQTSGFSSTFDFIVGEPNAALNIGNSNVTDVSCDDDNDGSITIFATGGTAPLTYTWDQGLPNGPIQNNLFAGTYNLTITDANGCTLTQQVVVEETNITLDQVTASDIETGNDGSINIEVSGGSGSYTYSWTGPGNFTASSQDLNNLSEAGEYCVTVTDNSGGCLVETCESIIEKLRFGQIIMTPSCPGQSTGSLQVQIIGGLAPVQYEWRNSDQVVISTSQNLTGQPGGTYSIYVFDASGDDLAGTFEITTYPEIDIDADIVNVVGDVNDPSGSISLTFPGGQNPTVVWENGVTGPVLNNLLPGEYCATITNPGNNCEQQSCFTVGFEPAPLAITSASTTDIGCHGAADGVLTIDFFGGFPPYIIGFEGETYQTIETIYTFTGLPAGNYSVTITDAEGNMTSINNNLMISEPDPIAVTATVLHDTEEAGCGGRIELAITGGTPGYTVQWNTPSQGATLINLCEGDYFPTIFDANGCEMTMGAIEVTTFALDAEVTDSDCPEDASGSIDLLISGGDPDYSITWQNEDNEVVSTEEDPSGLVPGNYIVTVAEASGNVLTRMVSVGSQSDLGLSVEVTSDYNGFDVSCLDAADATVEATGLNSDGNYAYEWTRNDMLISTDATLTGAAPGAYQVSVIDGLGCVVAREVEVNAPPAIELNAVIKEVTCAGERDGEVVVTASGGATNAAFLYEWENGSVGPRISFLPGGSYAVTATDANNCLAVDTFQVMEPDPIVVTMTTEPADEECNGTARAIVVGGTPPYFYEWNAPTAPNEGFISGLCPGQYFVTVTDSRGCEPDEQATSGVVRDRRVDCIETNKVITPDGDGLNEAFIISCSDEFNDNHLEIYNRWGQLVYEADNYDCITPSGPGCWKGRNAGGGELPEGPYYYVFDYTGPDGDRIQVKGSLTLLRE